MQLPIGDDSKIHFETYRDLTILVMPNQLSPGFKAKIFRPGFGRNATPKIVEGAEHIPAMSIRDARIRTINAIDDYLEGGEQ